MARRVSGNGITGSGVRRISGNRHVSGAAPTELIIPVIQPGASYTGALDSGTIPFSALGVQGAGWTFEPVAAMTIPFERGAPATAGSGTSTAPTERGIQTDATWWFEDTSTNYVTILAASNDPLRQGISSVEVQLEGSTITLSGAYLWTYNPVADVYGATFRVESKPGLSVGADCLARISARIIPANGTPRTISTVVCLNTDGRFVRPARYVDPINGNDANAGTVGAPWKTIEKWANSATAVPSGGVVYMMPGTHTIGPIVKAGTWVDAKPISVRRWPGQSGAINVNLGDPATKVVRHYGVGTTISAARLTVASTTGFVAGQTVTQNDSGVGIVLAVDAANNYLYVQAYEGSFTTTANVTNGSASTTVSAATTSARNVALITVNSLSGFSVGQVLLQSTAEGVIANIDSATNRLVVIEFANAFATGALGGATALAVSRHNTNDRIGVVCVWEGINFNTDYFNGLVSSADDRKHTFIGCTFAPSNGDFRGAISMGYPEGQIAAFYNESAPFTGCAMHSTMVKFRQTGQTPQFVNSDIQIGVDYFYVGDHRSVINTFAHQEYYYEYRLHPTVNLTVAATPVFNGTTSTVHFNEAVFNGSPNGVSYLRVLQSANNVPVGNQGYVGNPTAKGYLIPTGAANVKPSGRYAVVQADLSALRAGDVVRIWSPGHADTVQAIDFTNSNVNRPKPKNTLLWNDQWDFLEAQAFFVEGSSAAEGVAAWETNWRSGYTVTTVGTALTLNLAANDATRNWGATGSTGPKLRFQKNMVIRVGTDWRRIVSVQSATSYTLDAALSSDVTAATFFAYPAYTDIAMVNGIQYIRSPGTLRGMIRHGNTNIGFHSCTFDAHYMQIGEGVLGFTVTDTIMPCTTGISGPLPSRDVAMKNNHYGLAVGNNPVSIARDTDGAGTTGAVTFNANHVATAGVSKKAVFYTGNPRDVAKAARSSTSVIGARIG